MSGTTINTNYQNQEHEKRLKSAQEHTTHFNHVHGKQKIGKDVILPSAGNKEAEKLGKKKGTEKKPTLPNPTSSFSGFTKEDGDEKGKTMGLIAIIGEVMALQAKSNSNFWSTLWKQASESMMIQVKFAPIIANAVKSAYDAQSSATKEQAHQSLADAVANGVGFLAAMGMGALMSDVDLGRTAGGEIDAADTLAIDETSNAEMIGENVGNEGLQEGEEVANDLVNNEEPGNWERFKRWSKPGRAFVGRAQKKATAWFGRGLQVAQGVSMGTQAVSGFFNQHYQTKQAQFQANEGQAQALNKESEQYAQFYGQSFSRSEDLRQGSQQNIDYAMNILKSCSDTITQTTTAMFRG